MVIDLTNASGVHRHRNRARVLLPEGRFVVVRGPGWQSHADAIEAAIAEGALSIDLATHSRTFPDKPKKTKRKTDGQTSESNVPDDGGVHPEG